MKKKILSVILSILTTISSLFLFTACKDEFEEEINTDQTQLFIGIYDGGFGHQWLRDLADEFEALYANEPFEEGKMGVQIIIDPKKTEYQDTNLKASISTGINDMYFSTINVSDFVDSDLLLDITTAVTTPLTEYGETRSIADKINTNAKNYQLQSSASGDKYYAIPNYIGFSNIVYDVDLFEEKKFYFATDGSWTSGRVGDKQKWVGQDGIEGTLDDGLPVTFDDYKKMIYQMKKLSVTPFIWSGAYSWYRTDMLTALWANYEGANDFSLNIHFTGTDSTFGPIDKTNGYLLQKQEGKRPALIFAEYVMSDVNNYAANSFGSSTHMGVQDEFLYSRKKAASDSTIKPIAMLWEGNWWENEAKNTIVNMATSAEYQNRRFGLMTFPRMDENANTNYVMYSVSPNANVFIRKNAVQPKLAKMFLRYTTTDKALRYYTKETGALRDMKYSLEESDLENMSYYKRAVWDKFSNANTTVVYNCDNSAFSKRRPDFLRGAWAFGAEFANTILIDPLESFKLYGPTSSYEGTKLTSAEYFRLMAETYDKNYWDKTYKN